MEMAAGLEDWMIEGLDGPGVNKSVETRTFEDNPSHYINV